MTFLFKKLSIAWKLPLMIVGAGGLVGICIGLAAYWNASDTLENEARVRLNSLLESRKVALKNYLGSIEQDLRFVASNPTTKWAMAAFRDSWEDLGSDQEQTLQRLYIKENPHPTGSKENLDAADDDSSYSETHRRYHPWFREFLRERGYYDIFLFDLDGNLIYTVFKELDYATNLVSGKYRDTDLGKAFRAARDSRSQKALSFYDFRPYAPSHGAPASFISKPILGKDKKPLGVLVFQMPIDRLNAVVRHTGGLGETGQVFLVGSDRLMRTDSRFTEESTILQRKVENVAVEAALRGEQGTAEVVDMYQEEAIAAYLPIEFNGTRWGMIAEIERHEILEPTMGLAFSLIAITLCALAGLAALGWWLARDVVNPLMQMVTAVDLIKKGEHTEVPGIGRYDEIGSVGRSLQDISHKGMEATRLRSALDSCSTMVMVANQRGELVYLNPCLQQMLKKHEPAIRQDLPSFDASDLLGSNFDVFHKNPSHNRAIVENLRLAKEVNINVGGRRLKLVVTPVKSESNAHLGTVVEWADKTAELAMQEEIDRVINAARQGDLSQVIDLKNIDVTYQGLVGGMNELTRVVAHAVDELAIMLAAMAGGDLNRKIEADFQGQFGELKDNANNTAAQLAAIVGEVKTSANEISTAASEISSGTEDLSHRTEQAASNLEETAAATEQMSTTVRQNADNAKEASELAENANNTATKGGSVVEQAVTAMSGIESSAQKITDIIGVIDEIAFQTNLLALNASVEAARAGEAGKGFAVVAQEVRQLAQRSAQAASDIKTLIQDSNSQVKDGVQLVNQAGGALGEIVDSIGKVTGIIREIANASQEQAAGVQEINSSINNMDQMTQQNSALVEESTAASRALGDQANRLSDLMAFFKVGKTAGKAGGSTKISRQANAVPRSKLSEIGATATADDSWAEF